MKILHLPVGSSFTRYKEAGCYDGYFSITSAEEALRFQNKNGQEPVKRDCWLSQYCVNGRTIEPFWLLVPDAVYARVTEPEVNEYGEVAP